MSHLLSTRSVSTCAFITRIGTAHSTPQTEKNTTSYSSQGCSPTSTACDNSPIFFATTGAKVVAGGSICTTFPEFAAQFFDAVCAGGVDSVRQVIADFERSELQPIYRSPTMHISSYAVDYSLLAKSGISPSVHLLEIIARMQLPMQFLRHSS